MSSVAEELKTLTDDLRSSWEDFKAEHTKALEEQATSRGEETAETKQTLERIDAKLDEKVDEINVRLQKLNLDDRRGDDEPSAARAAFSTFLRRGFKGLSAEDRETLSFTDGSGHELDLSASLVVSDDTEGGFLAPEEIRSEIIKGVVEFSPIREIATVRSTTRIAVKAPKRTQLAGAVWVGEVETRSETQNPKWGKEEIHTRELSAMADISRQDLEDTGFDIEDDVLDQFSEQFGVSEATAFVSGDGVDGKPEGFLTAADTGYLGANGIETVTSTTNDALNGDDFIELYFALKDAYARNGTWVMKRATVKAARKLKDAVDGQYIWQPGLAGLAPATILDRPYVEAIDMPAVANGALAVAFGDFRKGYWIVDRLQIETLRDPYTQASAGSVRFWARKRVGGQVVLPEALKLLEIQ